VARGRRAQWNDGLLGTVGLDEAAAWIEQQRADWTERFDLLDEHLTGRREQIPSRFFGRLRHAPRPDRCAKSVPTPCTSNINRIRSVKHQVALDSVVFRVMLVIPASPEV
jgi:hypothetical protein